MEYKIDIYKNNMDNSCRFLLWKTWNNPLFVLWLNPSTADENKPDQTIRRVMWYAQRNGFDGFIMLNLYPQRATNPDDLDLNLNEIIHNENMGYIFEELKKYESPSILMAYSSSIKKRWFLFQCLKDIIKRIETLNPQYKQIWDLTKNWYPRHPSRWEYKDLKDCNMKNVVDLWK